MESLQCPTHVFLARDVLNHEPMRHVVVQDRVVKLGHGPARRALRIEEGALAQPLGGLPVLLPVYARIRLHAHSPAALGTANLNGAAGRLCHHVPLALRNTASNDRNIAHKEAGSSNAARLRMLYSVPSLEPWACTLQICVWQLSISADAPMNWNYLLEPFGLPSSIP